MKVIKHLSRGFSERCCMYVYPTTTPPALQPPVLEKLSWRLLDRQSIHRTFADEPRREAVFLQFLERRSLGVCIYAGNEWAAHAWMAIPGAARPPHIPNSAAPDAFWIYFCATKTQFGGKGLYKFAQRLLLNEALASMPQATVIIDTTPENTPSRRAIISSGFTPAGMIYCSYFWLPRITRIPVHYRWNRSEQHPLLPGAHNG